MQLFSPIIASYKVMHAQFGNKCKYIESEDGVLLFFSEVSIFISSLNIYLFIFIFRVLTNNDLEEYQVCDQTLGQIITF